MRTGADRLQAWLNGVPTPAAQRALLVWLATTLEPIRLASRLPDYDLRAGTRLRHPYGLCKYFGDGRPPLVVIRCTADGEPRRWRRPAAIVATLLHELAHLRYRSHGPRFWILHRRLLDQAASAGVYDPEQDDPDEPARGNEKLAGSAADSLAQAARARRRARAEANRLAAKRWSPGAVAQVKLPYGPLSRAPVRVVAVGRGHLTVQATNGLIYRIAATLLEPAAGPSPSPSSC